jgi:hypothetical protein
MYQVSNKSAKISPRNITAKPSRRINGNTNHTIGNEIRLADIMITDL